MKYIIYVLSANMPSLENWHSTGEWETYADNIQYYLTGSDRYCLITHTPTGVLYLQGKGKHSKNYRARLITEFKNSYHREFAKLSDMLVYVYECWIE